MHSKSIYLELIDGELIATTTVLGEHVEAHIADSSMTYTHKVYGSEQAISFDKDVLLALVKPIFQFKREMKLNRSLGKYYIYDTTSPLRLACWVDGKETELTPSIKDDVLHIEVELKYSTLDGLADTVKSAINTPSDAKSKEQLLAIKELFNE